MMPGPAVSPQGRGVLRFFLVSLIWVLPMSGAFWYQQTAFQNSRNQVREETRQNLEEVTAHLARLCHAETFYQQWAERIVRCFQTHGDLVSLLAGHSPAPARVFLFDARGKRISFPVGSDEFKFASERCFWLLRELVGNPAAKQEKKDERILENFLGSSDILEEIPRNPRKLVVVASLGMSRLVGIFPFRTPAGTKQFLLVVVDLRKVDFPALGKSALKSIQRLSGNAFSFGFIDLVHEREPAMTFTEGAGVYSQAMIERRYLAYGYSLIPPPTGAVFRHPLFWLVLVVMLMFLQRFLLRVLGQVFLPIRAQVVFLFGLAGVGSIVTLLILGQVYREVRQDFLIRESFEKSQLILEKLDSEFTSYRQVRENRYKSILEGCQDLEKDFSKVRLVLEALKQKDPNLNITVTGSEGIRLYEGVLAFTDTVPWNDDATALLVTHVAPHGKIPPQSEPQCAQGNK